MKGHGRRGKAQTVQAILPASHLAGEKGEAAHDGSAHHGGTCPNQQGIGGDAETRG